MYLPRHFAEDDTAAAAAMARRAGFGHLIVVGPDGMESTPVPFVIDDGATLVRAHLARPNGVWKLAPAPALLVVPIIDAYISPTWYPSKAEHGKVVPTWNYEVVHLHGRLEAHDDSAWVATQIRDLTRAMEAALPAPWSVDDAPADFVTGLQRGIVGISLRVERVEAKRKLSQNKPDAELRGSARGLAAHEGRGAGEVAAAMHATRDGATG